jgi:hypothetical protein
MYRSKPRKSLHNRYATATRLRQFLKTLHESVALQHGSTFVRIIFQFWSISGIVIDNCFWVIACNSIWKWCNKEAHDGVLRERSVEWFEWLCNIIIIELWVYWKFCVLFGGWGSVLWRWGVILWVWLRGGTVMNVA